MAAVHSPQHDPVFDAASVGKSFPGIRALQGVSLAGYPGEVIAICGANGAGKSTFSRLLAGLRSASAALRLSTMPRATASMPAC